MVAVINDERSCTTTQAEVFGICDSVVAIHVVANSNCIEMQAKVLTGLKSLGGTAADKAILRAWSVLVAMWGADAKVHSLGFVILRELHGHLKHLLATWPCTEA